MLETENSKMTKQEYLFFFILKVDGSRSRSLKLTCEKFGTPYLPNGLNYHSQIWLCNRLQTTSFRVM